MIIVFTREEIEVLQRANREAYRAVERRARFVEDELDYYEDNALYQSYVEEMRKYLEIKLKLDKVMESMR